MRAFTTEVILDAEIQFATTGEPPKPFSPPHETADIVDIRVIAYATVKALRMALEQAERSHRGNDSALVPIDIWEGLNESEQRIIYQECCDQTAITHHVDRDQ